jgi:hypothetical protein
MKQRSRPVDNVRQFSSRETVVCVVGHPGLQAEKRSFAEGSPAIIEGLVHTPDFSDVGVCGDKSSIWQHESQVECGILFKRSNEGAGFHKILFGVFANYKVCLTSLTALLKALIQFDEVDAAEEFQKARTGDLVKDTHSTLFTLKQTRAPHHSKMLGECRDITSREIRELVNASLSLREDIHHQQTRGVSHCFDDD